MGWMKRKYGMWGDEPQDVMDGVLMQKLGRGWYMIRIYPQRKPVR